MENQENIQASCEHPLVFAVFFPDEVNDSSITYACPYCGERGTETEGAFGFNIPAEKILYLEESIFSMFFPCGEKILLNQDEIDKLAEKKSVGPVYSFHIISIEKHNELIDIPKDKNYPSDSVQCDDCGGFGCGTCDNKGWLTPATHPKGRRCAFKPCGNPIFPNHIAVYCSDGCAICDA